MCQTDKCKYTKCIVILQKCDGDNVCKGRKMYMAQKLQQPFGFFFHDFPAPRPDSITSQAWKIWTLNSTTFQDLCAPCNVRKPKAAHEYSEKVTTGREWLIHIKKQTLHNTEEKCLASQNTSCSSFQSPLFGPGLIPSNSRKHQY